MSPLGDGRRAVRLKGCLLGELDLALPIGSRADLCSGFLMSLLLLWEFRKRRIWGWGENIPDKMDQKDFIRGPSRVGNEWHAWGRLDIPSVTQRFQDLRVCSAFLHHWNGSGITVNQLTYSA